MDFKQELIDELKKRGLNVAEDLAMEVIEVVFTVGEKAIVASENKYDDFLLAVLPQAKKMLMDLADEIDGKEG